MDYENLQEILTCGICLETFDESSKCPRMLSCGHSFCHSCLVKLLLLAQNPCCATCRAGILFQNTDSVPINFSLKSLINIHKTSSRKYLSEGYCEEHENFNELRCMNCEVWICGLCSSLQHKHCRTLVVKEAYKELKQKVSQKVEKELCQRKNKTDRLTESLRALAKERRSLIKEIKRKELELKDREKRIQELESLKAEENKFCDKLKQLQSMVENSGNDAEFSKNSIKLEKFLQQGKNQIPVDFPPRHLPQTREALGTLCQNRSVYAVEDRYDGTRYGKVALKDGRILVDSFQLEKPGAATLFQFPELFSWFNNASIELPKAVFLRVTSNDGSDSFEVIIETKELTPRAKNFIFLCSALKGPSYKGEAMRGGSSYYYIHSASPPLVEGIRVDDPGTPLKEGVVCGKCEGNSRFLIPLEDLPSYSHPKFGFVVAGLQRLKELREKRLSVEECGLVI